MELNIKKVIRNFLFLFITLVCSITVNAQNAPSYTKKTFAVNIEDSVLLKKLELSSNEKATFVIENIEIWDVDDNNTTHVKFTNKVKVCFVEQKGKLHSGKVNVYVFMNPEMRPIKVWEQSYEKGVLNGQWSIFNLKGTLVRFETYKNNVLLGVSRNYGIDGIRILSEKETSIGIRVIEKEFYENGKIKQIRPYKDNKLEGEGTRYYENGVTMENVSFKKGEFHGVYSYYYPNGQKWIEIKYKNGTPWTVMGNYLSSGEKRNSGTLKNGTGTLIYYNENGEINEIHEYRKGIRMN